MSALGVPPRLVAAIAALLAAIAIALTATGTFSPTRGIITTVALLIVAGINLRRSMTERRRARS